MARKFLKLYAYRRSRRRERERKRRGPFSLADCTSGAMSPNGTVIARNPIYQDSLRPSAMLCTASRRFSLCHSSLSLPLHPPPAERVEPDRRRRAATVVALSRTFTMSRGLRAPRTENGDPRCRHYFCLSSATTVIIFLARYRSLLLFLALDTRRERARDDPEIRRAILIRRRSIVGSIYVGYHRRGIDLKPRHHFECINPRRSAITFHVPISLIRRRGHCAICRGPSFHNVGVCVRAQVDAHRHRRIEALEKRRARCVKQFLISRVPTHHSRLGYASVPCFNIISECDLLAHIIILQRGSRFTLQRGLVFPQFL